MLPARTTSPLLLLAALIGLALVALGCSGGVPPLRAELQGAAATHDPVALSEALEQLIDAGTVTDDDREAAYHAVSSWPVEQTAAFHFGRAAVTGRLAQVRGLSAIGLVGEVETHARKSIELDPKFRDGAATRMLGTLYVLAPGSLLDHGDSEEGLELLEKVRDEHPDDPQNHLRVAEGYIALGDSEPAPEPLCVALAHRPKLSADDRRLLDKLVEDEGGAPALACPAPPAAATPASAPSAAPAAPTSTPAATPASAPKG
jgi:hypothetical protein